MRPTSRSNAGSERFNVQSADGTSIAVLADGDGPPLRPGAAGVGRRTAAYELRHGEAVSQVELAGRLEVWPA